MRLHNKTFLAPDDEYDDSYLTFYFSDTDKERLSSGFTLGDGAGMTVTFGGDSADEIKKLELVIAALVTFRDLAAGRLKKSEG